MKLSGDLEVLVIGAGAAGLAAGARLRAAGIKVQILEARARAGGRAQTVGGGSFPLDFGCGWLHSADRNPWAKIAVESGFAIDKVRPAWGRQSRDLSFPAEDQAAFEAAFERFEASLAEAGSAGADFAASHLLEPCGRWNGLINAVSTYMNGAELERVSARDTSLYADSGVNWRVVEGYGAVIADYGKDISVHFCCEVRLIDHGGPRLAVETSRGSLTADAVIVTVPTPILASERIRFRPSLPGKVEAAARLPLGVADKIFFAIDQPELLPKDGHVFGHTDRTETGSYHLRPFGRPLIEGFFGGSFARELEQAGPDTFFEVAAGELCGLLGSALRGHLRLVATTSWALDPYAQGSYSHALPGFADARKILAAPVEDRLFFAGEACSRNEFSTAHGAYATGIEAAEQVIAEVGKGRR